MLWYTKYHWHSLNTYHLLQVNNKIQIKKKKKIYKGRNIYSSKQLYVFGYWDLIVINNNYEQNGILKEYLLLSDYSWTINGHHTTNTIVITDKI